MNETFLKFSPNEMTINFNVFRPLMKREILCYAYNRFIVTIDNKRFKNISMQIMTQIL